MSRQERELATIQELEEAIAKFEFKAQTNKLARSEDLIYETLTVLKICILSSTRTEEIENNIIEVVKRLKKSVPLDILLDYVGERVINALNEEMNKQPLTFYSDGCKKSQSVSFIELLSQPISPSRSNSFDEHPTLKYTMLRVINEYMEDIHDAFENISKKAEDYIHNDDVIMTMGYSKSTIEFFKRAAQRGRKFTIIIPEHSPLCDGNRLAQELSAIKGHKNQKSNISVVLVSDASVFAIMAKVTMVIVPAKAVLADGNVIATSFVKPIAMAAKYHSVPVVVLYWKWKLTERFVKPKDSFTHLGDPRGIYAEYSSVPKEATILSPEGEILPRNLIKIYFNEDGPHGPEDIFPLMQSIYQRSSLE